MPDRESNDGGCVCCEIRLRDLRSRFLVDEVEGVFVSEPVLIETSLAHFLMTLDTVTSL